MDPLLRARLIVHVEAASHSFMMLAGQLAILNPPKPLITACCLCDILIQASHTGFLVAVSHENDQQGFRISQ